MQITVTTTAQKITLPGAGGMLQNLDASAPIFFSLSSDVTASGPTGGFRLDPGVPFEVPAQADYRSRDYWVVSTGSVLLAYGGV